MARQKEQLSERERMFCEFYFLSGNVKASAAKAGYGLLPEIKGLRLLRERRIAAELERLRHAGNFTLTAKEGFARLAFGSVADAVRLVLGEEFTASDIEKLDLFNIAEIKKPKDGSLEIKFFDRIKALENLAELDEKEIGADAAMPFYRALEESAARSSATGRCEAARRCACSFPLCPGRFMIFPMRRLPSAAKR